MNSLPIDSKNCDISKTSDVAYGYNGGDLCAGLNLGIFNSIVSFFWIHFFCLNVFNFIEYVIIWLIIM